MDGRITFERKWDRRGASFDQFPAPFTVGVAGKDTGVLAHALGIFACFEKQKCPRRRETSSALV